MRFDIVISIGLRVNEKWNETKCFVDFTLPINEQEHARGEEGENKRVDDCGSKKNNNNMLAAFLSRWK